MKNKTKCLLFMMSIFIVMMTWLGINYKSDAIPNHTINVTTAEQLKAALADDTYEVVILDADITLNKENTSSYYEINVEEEAHRKLDLNGHTLTQGKDVTAHVVYKNDDRIFEIQDFSQEKTGKVIAYGIFANIYNEQHNNNAFIFNHITYENNGNGAQVLCKGAASDKPIHFTIDGVTFYYPNGAPLSDIGDLEILDFIKVLPKNQTNPIGFYNDSNVKHLSDILNDSHELYLNGELWTGNREETWARDIYFDTSDTNGAIEIREKAYMVNFDTGMPDVHIPPEKVKENGLVFPPEVWLPQYECVGWYKEPELQNLWEFETDTVQKEMTLYGKFVEREAYDVYVGGHRFTKEHLTINLDEGTATFDPEKSLLTLNNVSVTNTYEWKTWYEACIYSEIPVITITLVGNNTITPNSQYGDAIDVPAGRDVIIDGNGVLNITGGYYGMYIGEGGEPGGNLTIQNGAIINVTNTDAAGLWVNNNIDIIGSTVTILKEVGNYSGIVSNEYGTITVDSSTVTITTRAQAIHFGTPILSDHRFHLISGNVTLTSTADGANVIHSWPDDSENVVLDISLDSGRLELNVPKGGGMGTNAPEDQIHILSDFEYTKGTSLRDASTAEEGIQIVIETVQPFPDVLLGKWYTPGIKYVKEKGIMSGYTSGPNAGNFGLNDTITRGQIATMLYRLAGSPDTAGLTNPFTDVPEEKYYTEPIKWAFSKGITTGKTATSFDPNGNVTRQELAVFMARYAKEILGIDTTSTYDITGIADYSDLSTWAIAPMQYIMEKGVITGDMKLGYARILPRNNATRAEAATMFMRFCQNILKLDEPPV